MKYQFAIFYTLSSQVESPREPGNSVAQATVAGLGEPVYKPAA